MMRNTDNDELEHASKQRNNRKRLQTTKYSTYSHLNMPTIDNESTIQQITYETKNNNLSSVRNIVDINNIEQEYKLQKSTIESKNTKEFNSKHELTNHKIEQSLIY